MDDQLQRWRLNTQLLIGILACLGVGLVFVFMFWTVLRTWLFASAQRRGERRFKTKRLGADGAPLPPTALGLCDKCGKVSDNVYHLADGRRLCETCFTP